MENFLDTTIYTYKNQFEFKEGPSTNEAIQKVTEETTKHLDNGKKCRYLSIRSSKNIWHNITDTFIETLYKYGVRDTAYNNVLK